MAKVDERLQMIGSAILNQSEAESKKIIRKANEIRETAIHEWEDVVIKKMFDDIQQQTAALRNQTESRLARFETELHRSLLLRREELTKTVFAAVRTNLLAHTATPEYRTNLLAELAELKDSYDHTATVVNVRECDLDLAPDIRAALGAEVEVQADRSIKIGGFTLYNQAASVLVDRTLDSRLQEVRPWFLQHCNMRVSVGDSK